MVSQLVSIMKFELFLILNSLLLLCLRIIPKLNYTNTPHAHGYPHVDNFEVKLLYIRY